MTGRTPLVVTGRDPVGRRFADMLRHHGYTGAVRLVAPPAGLDRAGRRLVLRDGTTCPYGILVLATGVEARPADATAPGGDATIHGGDATVVGGGVTAVETAARLASRGVAVTLACPGPYPLADLIDPDCAALLSASIPATVVGDTDPTGFPPSPGPVVRCPDPVPDAGPARAAGLRVEHGVLVDDQSRTSDPHIYAIGGCAQRPGRPAAGPLETWERADALAHLIARGTPGRPVATDVLRLRAGPVDLTCAGPAPELDRNGVRTVRFADRAGRRYARIALRDERVIAAVLLGLPSAAAVVSHAYRYGRPLPTDRLGLLLGLPAGRGAAGPPGPATPVCLCNNVSRDRLYAAWLQGCRGRDALAGRTRAGTGCGGCRDEIDELCTRWQREEAST